MSHLERTCTQRRLAVATAIICKLIALPDAMPQTPKTPAAAPLTFETVSIRRNTGFATPLTRLVDGDFVAINVSVRALLMVAYGPANGVGWDQIDHAPEWMDSDRFDILGKAPVGATPQQVGERLHWLLADRFKLVTHIGLKELPIYALITAEPGGTLGPRLTRSRTDCRSSLSASTACGISGTASRLMATAITMAEFVASLADHLAASSRIRFDRPVIDLTGLSGSFDLTVEWTPDPVAANAFAPIQSAVQLSNYRPYAFPLESHAPKFLKAFQEQLGLKLEPRVAPQPVLIIDRIVPPMEN